MWEHNGEINMQLDHLRPSWFHQMSRQHIKLSITFCPYTTMERENRTTMWRWKHACQVKERARQCHLTQIYENPKNNGTIEWGKATEFLTASVMGMDFVSDLIPSSSL